MTGMQLCIVVLLAVVNFPIVVAVDRWARQRKQVVRRVYEVDPVPGQTARELRNGLLTTPIHALLIAVALLSDSFQVGGEGPGLALLTFAITFVWTEVWHYASHRLMHVRSLHFIHREHHRSRVTQAWTSVSFSILEKTIFSLGILGFMSLVSQVIPLSFYGLASYYFVYFYTNALGHSNIEIRKPGYGKTILGKLFNTPSYHAMHHARYTRNYGLLTPWVDRVFGTAWEDSDEVQSRAALGRPLARLQERATPNTERTLPPHSSSLI